MQMRLKQKAKSNQLQIGDRVTIANRFFANHGLKRSLVGTGTVLSVSIPYVRVQFITHHIFVYCKANGFIKSLVMPENNISVVEINSVYLEKAK
jgi:hypothetical protein